MKLFSTEQISKYHPDKYADQISDAILTAYLKVDPTAHCGIETMVKGDSVILGGEITSTAKVDHGVIVRRVADKLKYDFCEIIDYIGKQSDEINKAVISDENIGAGDQGMMFGYATDETESYLPLGFDIANKIIKVIEEDVENNPSTILKGDAKTQVTIDMDTNEIYNVLISVCHKEEFSVSQVRTYIQKLISDKESPALVPFLQINPAGAWTKGGPVSDCGLTGRKIVCDQYGGYCPVGGGAFSGKDPSKVDRSASYMARKIAVDMVKKYGGTCSVQLAYAIGVAEPVSVSVESSVAGNLSDEVIKSYDLTPRGIIKTLDLLNKDYEKIAEGCHYREDL